MTTSSQPEQATPQSLQPFFYGIAEPPHQKRLELNKQQLMVTADHYLTLERRALAAEARVAELLAVKFNNTSK